MLLRDLRSQVSAAMENKLTGSTYCRMQVQADHNEWVLALMLGVLQSNNLFRLCDYVRGIYFTTLISFNNEEKRGLQTSE